MDVPIPEDNVMYNRFVILDAKWTSHVSATGTRPQNAVTGWTSLKGARITQALVDQFRQTNDGAALADLAKNPLYDLSKWDHDGWNSYMWWMATGT